MNNTMKKGGRPRLLNTEKKKYKLPPVRLGTVDYVTVKNRSKQAGLTLTEYQRQMVLHGQVVERVSAEQMELYRQLAGMMMAKITKGRDFGGAVRYVTQDKKEAKILDSKGVLTTDKQSIINSFRLQSQLRPDVKVMVGHISLDFSVEDVDRMSDDFMVKIAWEYMQRMNILNTQFIIARHYDREHPHSHIIFNRIGNNGKVISDRNDRVRSAKICRSLTEKYHLHLANGKDHVHRDRLRGADAVKYHIYDALEATVPRCRNWDELRTALAKQGIKVSFTCRGTTADIQGVVFEKEGLRFNG